MNDLQKISIFKKAKLFLLLGVLLISFKFNGQIANYVSDGGFEVLNSNSVTTLYNVAKFWQPIDTNKDSYYVVSINSSINPAPNCSYGFQYPRSGSSFALSTFYSNVSFSPNYRGYLRNRLKQTLEAGKTYCVKYYIVNTNNSPLAIDRFGAYFANSSLDTITQCNLPLTYLTPQVENVNGIITDTLNWIPITGTILATGNEKYMVIGDFYSGLNTNTLLINPTYSSTLVNDIYIDDVSVIELTLQANAGPDIWGIPTTTVYLGRQQDVGIDEACMWYKLPNTTTAIDTAAGITVTVASTTTTYMVKQDICGMIKYDTVVVYASGLGNVELQMLIDKVTVYPIPANDILNVDYSLAEALEETSLKIINALGQIVKEEVIRPTKQPNDNLSFTIKTDDLVDGVYVLSLGANPNNYQERSVSTNSTSGFKSVSKRFVIAR